MKRILLLILIVIVFAAACVPQAAARADEGRVCAMVVDFPCPTPRYKRAPVLWCMALICKMPKGK